MSQADFFQRIGWFDDLEPSEFHALRSRSRRVEYDRGATVFAPTVEPHSVYVLEAGSVRIYRLSSSGEEATLGYVAPGEVFGELPGFGAFHRESFAAAQSPSATWKIPVGLFRALLSDHPPLMGEVARQVAERMKRVESRVESLILGDVRQRLAAALLELSDYFGKTRAEGEAIRIPLSQMQLGTLIGATRQSVNSAMAEFQAEGWVRQEGATVTLLRPGELQKLLESK